MEYVTESRGTEVVLPPAPLLVSGCLFPCPLAPRPASSYLLSVAHWSLMHLLPKALAPALPPYPLWSWGKINDISVLIDQTGLRTHLLQVCLFVANYLSGEAVEARSSWTQ